MNTIITIIQYLLAGVFFIAGMMKLMKGRSGLAPMMPWVKDFSERQIRGIGMLEVLGVIGLVVPFLTGILPILTPAAALGFVFLMVGATMTHRRRGERNNAMMTMMLLVLAAIVAVGRFMIG